MVKYRIFKRARNAGELGNYYFSITRGLNITSIKSKFFCSPDNIFQVYMLSLNGLCSINEQSGFILNIMR
jgi:hypothetical protein